MCYAMFEIKGNICKIKESGFYMKRGRFSINLSIAVLCVVSVALAVFLIIGPMIFNLYMTGFRGFESGGAAITKLGLVCGICFYSAAVFATVILYALFRLLFNIKREEVFILKNATYLRIVSWCSFAIALITFVGGIYYMPLLFIAMAAFFAGVLLRVVKNVMYSAIELKQDNDLTI